MRTTAASYAAAGVARLLVLLFICPWVQQFVSPDGGTSSIVFAARRTSPLLTEESSRRRPAMSAGKDNRDGRGTFLNYVTFSRGLAR
jgi:hypothetical protein